ncbi:solute carrier organic anion transporter family member 4A1 [Pontoporia blainvillei]|uniref:Solute carrier organic anion transporter family member 4A1 n=1 Tax=Pontoporia blainvillei TaxID=48723 RepID=A0ABX0S8Z1_PONBL|nr:solute carrier organic anion transporter family member 4A1 [Pontoporia blainvillei]
MWPSEGHLLESSASVSAHLPHSFLSPSIWLLLKNPTFILLCLAGATEATLITGMSTFGPKFLESQFSLSASEAATLFGYLVVPAGGGGTFLGGFFVNKCKLRGSGIIKFCLLCSLISMLAFLVFFMHCPNVPMAGVTASYNGSLLPEGHLGLTDACNAACGCQPEHYNPVCGPDGLMYYSPCHAGCPEAALPGPGGQKNLPFAAKVELCRPPRGGIPGPIAFGWLIDKACLLWQNQCGQQGSCFVYQNSAMSQYLLIAGLAYKVLGFVFFTTACFLYKPLLGSSDGLEASLPSQSSASDNPTDLQEAPSAL